MCEAEEEVRRLEHHVESIVDASVRLCDRIEDCDRGIIDIAELRRDAIAQRERLTRA